ncbi:ABC transporter ATP-binding protein [Pseudofrankia inefficax]|uniref:ABC transporter related protein n=1 Tax=Pseudofrankia inefficax (strain DSM 45817 / CECT 9037 / DDB 130130 / EuI1c) TaxID=298654 RepID=E3J8J9_PSEI1|nr:ABC transporter related protein [Pseudofrankia inefficax]
MPLVGCIGQRGVVGGGVTEAGIRLTGVTRSYGDVLAVEGVDLAVPRGRRLAVVGPSGCGKSTILGLMSGLDEPDQGVVDVLGATDQAARLARCAWMPQRDLLLPWRSALANAAVSLENRGISRREARAVVRPLFARFGLAGFEEHRPRQLSGGMRQRVAFLRTFVAGKEVLLLDEPFGALDAITRAEAQDWLRAALEAEPRTVVLVTHDVEEALLLGHEIVVLTGRPGKVAASYAVDLPAAATRRELLATPEFIQLRDKVLAALEQRPSAPVAAVKSADGSPNPVRRAEG